MLAIICFDLIPEAMEISKIINVIIAIAYSLTFMDSKRTLNEEEVLEIMQKIIDAVQNKCNASKIQETNSLLKTGIVVSIGLALHNFPEGLAIGSGFGASLTLGYSLAIAICFHDIPERNFDGSSNEKWRNEKN